ncbi:hypothetical protein BH09PLA1_BH09PLA1_32440 [soil metagenome]
MITSDFNFVWTALLASASAGASGGADFWHDFFHLPPLHPILVNFAAALLPASVVCDLLARATRRESLRSAAWWMLCFAAITTPLAAAAGWLWYYQMGSSDHAQMIVHQWLGSALAIVVIPLAVWRWRQHRQTTGPSTSYLIVACLLVLTLMFQGHLGGMMSFGSDHADAPATGESHGHADESGTGWQDQIELKK